MSDAQIDKKQLRQVLGSFVTGVTVITTVDDNGTPYGLTANSFSSVSLEPPLVLWSQSITAPSHPVFRRGRRFAVNILSESQIDVSRRFSTMGADKFAHTPHRAGLGGVPLLDGCCATIECVNEAQHEGGDHTIFIGRVEALRRHEERPLVFGSGKYLAARQHDLGDISADFPFDAPNLFYRRSVPMATEVANELSATLNQAVAVAVWGNHGPTVIHWRQPAASGGMNLQPGFVMPVASSATGLAFAANLPSDLTDKPLREELGWPRGAGLKEDTQLDATLAEVRSQHLARVVDSHAFADIYGGAINALSVPVFDQNGKMVLALSAIGPTDSLDPGWDAPPARQLREAAETLSRRLGHASAASVQPA